MKAFVCEPSRFVQRVIVAVLRDAGFQSRVFATPEELLPVVAQAGESSAQLICISLQYRGTNGVEVARTIRTNTRLAKVPIALVTGTEDAAKIAEALEAGVTEVFYKSHLEALFSFANGVSVDAGVRGRLTGKVLYVEDSPSAAQVVSKLLTDAGLEVRHVASAEAALELFRADTKSYDLILTDFLLQGKMTGLGLVREVRRSAGNAIPILVLSGFDDPTRKVEILTTGANDYVTKPMMPEELMARVRILTQSKHMLDQIETQRQRLFFLATRDQLTGLLNRASTLDQGAALIETALGSGADLGLVMVDLDRFKSINDQLGHGTGDKVLTAMGRVILETVGTAGLAGRMGGEEFMIILDHAAPATTADFCERLRRRVEALKPENIPVTASLGFTNLSVHGQPTIDAMYDAADRALYAAKHRGRNRVERATPDSV